MPSRPVSVALLGATGLVGRTVLELLAESELDLAELRLFASPRSAGTRLDFDGEELPVAVPSADGFRGCDLAIFCTPADVSRAWAGPARDAGCLVVDDSPAFRLDPEVPLVLVEVNPAALDAPPPRGIVSNPSGPVAPLAAALAPLHAAAGLERAVVTTFQATSGAGHRAVEQLERETADLMNGREPEPGGPIPHRIAFNLVPQVGAFLPDGRTEEEAKIADETRKVLGLPSLGIAATAVRVPVFFGHALSVNVTTARPLAADVAREVLRKARGVKVVDAPGEGIYPMPMLAVNDDAVLVGRVRADPSQASGLDLFLVADNLRRGAATNLVAIATLLAERHLPAR
jgi:aspartate-semialdehyde dehydrogenase